MNTSNCLFSALRNPASKKFVRLIIWHFVVVANVEIIMPSVIQAFPPKTQYQGSEIRVSGLDINAISTENFTKWDFIRLRSNIMSVSQKEQSEFASRVDILVTPGYKKSEDNANQGADDPRKDTEDDQYSVWQVLFHALIILVSFTGGALIGVALAYHSFYI